MIKLSNTSIKTRFGTVKQFEDKFQVIPAAHYQNYHKAKGWVIKPLDGLPKVLKDNLALGTNVFPTIKDVKTYIAMISYQNISELINLLEES